MKILLTGLVSVHWGRVENGNIGNYYIVETTVRELHRVFPDARIVTTFQMTKEFCEKERIEDLPLSLYYSWNENDLKNAYEDYSIACIYKETGTFVKSTPYIDLIKECDLVCDFSGEMWGDHAEPVGENRFFINLLKMRTAQLIGVKTVLLAGSQGPFILTNQYLEFAKVVYKNFNQVLNREAASEVLLKEYGFNTFNVRNFTDPAFLFEPFDIESIKNIIKKDNILSTNKPTVGFILCGFNMIQGPYDKENRSDDEYLHFVNLIEFIINELNSRVFLMSHQNGFEKEGDHIKLINGRDYPFAQKLFQLINERGNVNIDDIVLAKGPYNPKETKAIIGQFDMFITGRIHAFVAAVSQCVPTVIINRGHGGISHRNIGFAKSVGLDDYISNPSSIEDMKAKVTKCWNNRDELRLVLKNRIPEVVNTAHELFNSLKLLDL